MGEVDLSNSSASLTIQGISGLSSTLTAADSFTNSGTINLTTTVNNRSANLNLTNGSLVNNGSLNFLTGSGSTRSLGGSLTNNNTINIEDNTSVTFAKSSGVYTNNGTFDIGSGATLAISSSSQKFTQAAGTLDTQGTFTITSATFDFNGGTITGNSPIINASTLNIGSGSTGVGTFLLRNSSAYSGN